MTEKKKSNRPRFFAPKAPIPPANDKVVENEQPEEHPVVEAVVDNSTGPKADTGPVVEVETPPKAPVPPGPKEVTKLKSDTTNSPLNEVLADVSAEHSADLPNEASEKAQISDKDFKSKPEPVSANKTPTPSNSKKTSQDTPPSESSTLSPTPPPPDNKPSTNFILVIVTLFCLVLATVGWFMYFSASGTVTLPNLSGNPTATPTTSPTLAPTPTPNPRRLVRLEVLNGSGTAGAAGQTAEKLAKLGYTIVKTGNADNQKYLKTEIYLSPKFLASDYLFTDLLDFGTATKSGTLSDSTASARIIIGKNWAP
jgi:hypothetical protein